MSRKDIMLELADYLSDVTIAVEQHERIEVMEIWGRMQVWHDALPADGKDAVVCFLGLSTVLLHMIVDKGGGSFVGHVIRTDLEFALAKGKSS